MLKNEIAFMQLFAENIKYLVKLLTADDKEYYPSPWIPSIKTYTHTKNKNHIISRETF